MFVVPKKKEVILCDSIHAKFVIRLILVHKPYCSLVIDRHAIQVSNTSLEVEKESENTQNNFHGIEENEYEHP